MKAKDLKLFELLTVNPDQGSITIQNRRMLLWDADAFGGLRNELIRSMGIEYARPLLKRFGFANGYRDAKTMGDIFSWDNDTEWWLSCPALQQNEGKVKPTPQKLVVDRQQGAFHMEVLWDHSYEAQQHLRVFGRSDQPVCWTIAGYASGFSTALMGQEVYVVEEKCVARGDKQCLVVGKTKHAWGAVGQTHAAEYEVQNLAKELEQREQELARQRRAILRAERKLEKIQGSKLVSRGGFVAKSQRMDRTIRLAESVAKVDSTALITGESGVGKELMARFIHEESQRAQGPFVAINCGALPETLLESELFGHKKGSFTGADADRPGLFQAGKGGSLLLDEVGEMSKSTQVRLLRVLQEREVRPVGETKAIPIDVRVIAATNRNLEAMVASGEFREDLYYRLAVVSIEIPPLRERTDDILPLAREFVHTMSSMYKLGEHHLEAPVVDALVSYSWPGNIRELRNVIERAVVLAGNKPNITIDHLSVRLRENGSPVAVQPRGRQVQPIADIEKQYILHVLDRFEGNRTHTARALGIGSNTLWRKLKSWGIPPARN